MRVATVIVFLLMTHLTACVGAFAPKIGMSERRLIRTTLIGPLVYMEDNVKAYRSVSGGTYYYFKDGVLVRIDQELIPAERIQLEVVEKQQ